MRNQATSAELLPWFRIGICKRNFGSLPLLNFPCAKCYPQRLGILRKCLLEQFPLSIWITHEMSSKSAQLSTKEISLGPEQAREQVFDAFRRWGYLDANLNPFGGPIGGGYSDLPSDGEHAEAASQDLLRNHRRGVHAHSRPTAADGFRTAWKSGRTRRPRWLERRFAPTSSSRSCSPATSAPSVFPLKATPRLSRCWMRSWKLALNTVRRR